MAQQHIHTSGTPSERLIGHESHWRRFGVHRASQKAQVETVSSGWSELDRLLPGGGYPLGAVTELLIAGAGTGELSLLLRALTTRMAMYPRHRTAFVSPPYRLNAPALSHAGIDCARVPILTCRDNSERVWCIEQMAHSRTFAAFVLWGESLDTSALRRLQLAAEKAVCPVFVYRSIARAPQRSPAALRLAVRCTHDTQQLEVLKCRGPAGARLQGLHVTRDMPWQMNTEHGFSIADTVSACNDSNDRDHHGPLARPAFSPLGTR